MTMIRCLTVLAGLLCGYALAIWAGLCRPEGECLTWGVLAATGGVGTLAHEVAALVFNAGDGPGFG